MTPIVLMDSGGKMLIVDKEAITHVWHFTPPPPVLPAPPNPCTSCVVLFGGIGLYVQESVEKIYKLILEK